MRPIASLTASAREIASTRDTSRRIPTPDAADEVAELARTLDQMLRELDAARSETEQMMQAQREFVADASHELRTPLTSILANLELLRERLDAAGDGMEDQEIVDSALRSSRRMSSLVGDLLLLARADAGRTGARRECDLAAVAADAMLEMQPIANGRRMTMVNGTPVPVEGNADELHRLTINLLDNGLRHTPAGTEIRISVERRNGDAVLEVSDDGPGLPPGMEEQIFSRFVRGVGPADVAGDSGVGLGLAIVRAVATSHGGAVDAGSTPSGGARFTVKLPLTKF
jgi:signal transduction histidine kinase